LPDVSHILAELVQVDGEIVSCEIKKSFIYLFGINAALVQGFIVEHVYK